MCNYYALMTFRYALTWYLFYSILIEVLQLIHDFLPNGNTVRSSLYIFIAVLLSVEPLWPSAVAEFLAHCGLIVLLRIGERGRFQYTPGHNVHQCQARKSNCMFNKFKIKLHLSHFR